MANQITINIGAAANDGTGDPLRTAFNDVNLNFSNVWNTGLPSSNVQFSDNRILTTNTNANLILSPNGIGKVTSNVDIVPNLSNVHSLGGLTNRWNTVYTQALNTTGNITVAGILTDNYFFANGAPFSSNSSSSYGNSNVAAFLPTYTGNISAGNASISFLVASRDIFAKTGTFSGDNNTGDNALYIGAPTFTALGTDVMAQFTGNVTNYGQINFQNYSSSPTSSGDYIATADNGNDSTHYIDMGITGSNWDGTQLNSLGTALSAGDGYLYVQDGNLALGVRTGPSTQSVWNFDSTGMLSAPGVVKTGVFATGNIPSAATAGAGARAFVTDADIGAWGNLYVGGASNAMPVWSNGTNWYIG